MHLGSLPRESLYVRFTVLREIQLLESRARATQDQEGSRGTALERLYRGETDWNLEKVGADMRLS